MTSAEIAVVANRTDKANRIAAEILRRASEQHIATDSADLVWYFDGLRDSEWFLIWRAARCFRCPSDETKRFVFAILYARLSVDEQVRSWGPGGSSNDETYTLTAADRALLLEVETAKAIGNCEVAREQP